MSFCTSTHDHSQYKCIPPPTVFHEVDVVYGAYCPQCDASSKKCARMERELEMNREAIQVLGESLNKLEEQRDRYEDMLIRAGILKDRR